MNNKITQTLFLFKVFLLLAFACPLSVLAQTLTPVAELTKNSDGSTYTITYKAVEGTPTYVTSGEGMYNLSETSYNTVGYKYGKNITRAVVDANMKDVHPTSTAYWFYDLSAITSIEDLENLNTSEVTNMSSMFSDCKSLTSLDLTNFNTSNVTNMSGMFSECESLTSLEVAKFNTSNVTNMNRMFSFCESLTSLEVPNFNTEKVRDMSGMFLGCKNLISLDINNFNTSNVTDMSFMFSSCSKLTKLSFDKNNFNTSKVTNMSNMFYYCRNLTELDVTKFKTQNVTNMHYMFCGCENLLALDVRGFDTGNVTDLSGMFYFCEKLKELDVTKFNTEKVTDMSSMFSSCELITNLDVTHFNTSNVKTFHGMFSGCHNLETLDVTNFDTRKATEISNMFQGCRKLESIDLTHFITDNVTTMRCMFWDCGIKSIDLSKFNTSNVTDVGLMFEDCSNLTSLDVSNFDFSKVTNVGSFIEDCNNLEVLNLGNNDISKYNWENTHNRPCYKTGTTTKPCYLIETFGREPLGKVTIDKDNQVPPYYQYCDGYFTIADTLDTEKDFKAKAKEDADLWVKARTMKGGVWNTMVLPAGVTQEQLKTTFGDDVEVCTLSGYDGKAVSFTTLTGTTTANTPVLVKPTSDIKNVGFAEVKIENGGTDAPTTTVTNGNLTASFIGSYKQIITIGRDCYYYYAGRFVCSAGNSTVRNTRGYFTFSDGGTGAKRFVLDDSGMTTGIDAIDGEPVGEQGPVYNLAGQRVGKDYKGIVIIGGKKVLRK